MLEEKQTSLTEQEAGDEGDQDTPPEKPEDGDESEDEPGDDDDDEDADSPEKDPNRYESNGDPHQSGPRQAGVGDHKMSIPRRQAADED